MTDFHNELHQAIAETLAAGGPVNDELGAATEVMDLLVERAIIPPSVNAWSGARDDRALVPRWEVTEFVLRTYRHQQEKHGAKPDSLHRPATPNLARLRVLLEEVGEVAAELDPAVPLDLENLAKEVAQCGAVALGWLEGVLPTCDGCDSCMRYGCMCLSGEHITSLSPA